MSLPVCASCKKQYDVQQFTRDRFYLSEVLFASYCDACLATVQLACPQCPAGATPSWSSEFVSSRKPLAQAGCRDHELRRCFKCKTERKELFFLPMKWGLVDQLRVCRLCDHPEKLSCEVRQIQKKKEPKKQDWSFVGCYEITKGDGTTSKRNVFSQRVEVSRPIYCVFRITHALSAKAEVSTAGWPCEATIRSSCWRVVYDEPRDFDAPRVFARLLTSRL